MSTHNFIAARIADLLAHQLVHPVGLIALGGVGGDTGNDERHDDKIGIRDECIFKLSLMDFERGREEMEVGKDVSI